MASNALRALVAALAGGVGGYQEHSQLEQARREREQERLRNQQNADRSFGLQEQQLAEVRDRYKRDDARLDAESAQKAAALKLSNARAQATQYGQDEDLPEDLASTLSANGDRITKVKTPTTTNLGPKPLSLGAGVDLEGKSTVPASVTAGDTFGLGEKVSSRRGFQTPQEQARAAIEAEVGRKRTALANMPGLPESVRRALLAGVEGLGAVKPEDVRTPEEIAADQARERGEVTFKTDEDIRADRARIAAQAAAQERLIGARGAATPPKTGGGPSDQEKGVQLLGEALDTLKDISPDSRGFSSAVGAGWQSLPFMDGPPSGTPGATFKARFDRFRSLQVLPRLSVMKGLGQMSDMEFKVVNAASTDLDPKMEESEYKRLYPGVVDAITKAYKRAQAGTTVLNDPDGDGVPEVGQASGGGAGQRGGGAGPGAPKVGEERMINGELGVWNGRAWVAKGGG